MPFAGKSYTWQLIGPDSVSVTDICFGVALPYMMLCAENGMYLYNYSTQETEFYTYGLPVIGATHLNAEKFIVAMGDGSWSDGLWTFDLQTHEFEVIEWKPDPAFLYYCEHNSTYYAGFHFGGLLSSTDGLSWIEIPYFNGKSCVEMCSWEDHLVISTASNIAGIHYSDDSGESWSESDYWPPLTYDMQFSPEGVLYAIHPGISYSSGLYKSYDYGQTWDIEFWWGMMSAVGFDVFGNKFVGLDTQDPWLFGIAYFEMEAITEPNFIMFNEGLGNTFINKIKTNPTMSAPVLFVCTEGGAYYSYNIVIGEEEIIRPDEEIVVSPNPAFTSEQISISTPEIKGQVNIQLFSNSGKRVLQKKINNIENLKINLDLPEIKPGVYFLKLTTVKEKFTEKIIVQ